jgi:competence protein ComFC
MSIEINPRRLKGGPWADGYALDRHTLGSAYIGDNQFGKPMFDTQRSPAGELLYQLKYRQDKTAVHQLAEAAAAFYRRWKPPVDLMVPTPPSVTRKDQPVIDVAFALAELLEMPLSLSCLSKVKQTPQLKDIVEYDKRTEALQDAFNVRPDESTGKTLLLFDDLFGSGATARHIVEVLIKQGGAKAVYLLTLTTK